MQEGLLYNLNTIEGFKEFDRAAITQQVRMGGLPGAALM